jgi:AcrR family transcriptional regulator
MITGMTARKYTLRKRAEAQDETRARIVEATVALHEELGPAKTTISAIAERAGVQRLTVYRHFPDEVALFAACTAHWFADHPPPDSSAWSSLDADRRTHAALLALYRYYRRTERMWTVTYRDVDELPALQAPMQGFEDYLAGVQRELMAAWGPAGRARGLKAVVAHCLRFSTWQSLVRQGDLSDPEGAAACARWIDASLQGRKSRG